MDSVTKHKCSNNVERESKAMAQNHRYQKLLSWDQDSFRTYAWLFCSKFSRSYRNEYGVLCFLTGSVYVKIVTENEKKKIWKSKKFLHKSTVCNAYRYFAGQALLITSQSRSCMEYLLQTNTIIVHDVTLIWRRKLISLAGFTTIFLTIW